MNYKNLYDDLYKRFTNREVELYLDIVNTVTFLLNKKCNIFIEPDDFGAALYVFGEFTTDEFNDLFDVAILFEGTKIEIYLYNTLNLDSNRDSKILSDMDELTPLFLEDGSLSDESCELIQKILSE